MKKLISFLLCLVVGLVATVSITFAVNPIRGKPVLQTRENVKIQVSQTDSFLLQNQFFEVGNPKITITVTTPIELADAGTSENLKQQVIPRLAPEIVYRN